MRWRKDETGGLLYPVRMMSEPTELQNARVTADRTVAEILERWPTTAAVFVRYGTSCVGCEMSTFETLADASAIYHLSLDEFLEDLQQAARQE